MGAAVGAAAAALVVSAVGDVPAGLSCCDRDRHECGRYGPGAVKDEGEVERALPHGCGHNVKARGA